VQRRVERHDLIRRLRGERRERGDRAAELHEDLRAQRHLGVAVAGDDLLHGELAGHGELLRDRLRHAEVGVRGDDGGVRAAAQ